MSEAKTAFAGRLNQALDRLGIPAKQHGRFTAIARLFGVSAVAARSWCEGQSYPSVDKLLVIMDTVRCGADWLLYGRPGGTGGERAAPPQVTKDAAADAGADPTWHTLQSDAMFPTLLPGDTVRWQPEDAPQLEDGLYALQPEASGDAALPAPLRVRRLLRQLDGSVLLACDNPLYRESAVFVEESPGCLRAIAPGGARVLVLGRLRELRRALP